MTALINETHEQSQPEIKDTRSPENKAHHENLFSEIKHLLNINEEDSVETSIETSIVPATDGKNHEPLIQQESFEEPSKQAEKTDTAKESKATEQKITIDKRIYPKLKKCKKNLKELAN